MWEWFIAQETADQIQIVGLVITACGAIAAFQMSWNARALAERSAKAAEESAKCADKSARISEEGLQFDRDVKAIQNLEQKRSEPARDVELAQTMLRTINILNTEWKDWYLEDQLSHYRHRCGYSTGNVVLHESLDCVLGSSNLNDLHTNLKLAADIINEKVLSVQQPKLTDLDRRIGEIKKRQNLP